MTPAGRPVVAPAARGADTAGIRCRHRGRRRVVMLNRRCVHGLVCGRAVSGASGACRMLTNVVVEGIPRADRIAGDVSTRYISGPAPRRPGRLDVVVAGGGVNRARLHRPPPSSAHWRPRASVRCGPPGSDRWRDWPAVLAAAPPTNTAGCAASDASETVAGELGSDSLDRLYGPAGVPDLATASGAIMVGQQSLPAPGCSAGRRQTSRHRTASRRHPRPDRSSAPTTGYETQLPSMGFQICRQSARNCCPSAPRSPTPP